MISQVVVELSFLNGLDVRGFMSTKGNPNYDRAARIILKDYVKVS